MGGRAWKDLLENHSHLMISSFRETSLSLKLDGTEDPTLDFGGDHEPFGPMKEKSLCRREHNVCQWMRLKMLRASEARFEVSYDL